MTPQRIRSLRAAMFCAIMAGTMTEVKFEIDRDDPALLHEQVAAHIVSSDPKGDPERISLLVRAARAATADALIDLEVLREA